jgi:hypothetical protein
MFFLKSGCKGTDFLSFGKAKAVKNQARKQTSKEKRKKAWPLHEKRIDETSPTMLWYNLLGQRVSPTDRGLLIRKRK